MSAIVDYPNVATARANLKDLVDAAVAGVPSRLHRESNGVALVDADRLRGLLSKIGPTAEVVPEAGGWSIFVPGVPVAADGGTFEEAVEEMVVALREYADDWADHLRLAPNHRDHWGLVQLIGLSSDEQIAEWLVGSADAPR